MLNTAYYPSNNILSDIYVSLENDNYKQTDIEDSTTTNSFILNYNNNIPSLLDGTVYDLTSTVINIDNIEILPDSTAIIGMVIHDDFMKSYCHDLCNDDFKYTLDDFKFIISGYINTELYNEAIFTYKYTNIVNSNIIYDYVLNEDASFLYNDLLLDVIEKEEFTGYVNAEYFPEYTIKCIDSSNNIVYYKIKLVDLEYSQGNIISSTFYDMTSVKYNNYNIDVLNSCKNLPVLLKSNKFKQVLDDLRNVYTDIHILFNIKNLSSTDNIKIDDTNLYFNWYMGCKMLFNLEIDNINSLVDNKEYYLNRGAYFKYTSQELEDYYSEDKEKILFNINNIGFEFVDVDYDRSLLLSKNYITNNNYIPLELYNNKYNVLSITLKDLKDSKSWTLSKDFKFTLMNQLISFNQYSPSYNLASVTDISINNFGYLYASERTDFTTCNIETSYVTSKIFNSLKVNITALNISDITSIFELLNDTLNISIFWRKINKFNTIIYIKYNKYEMYNYLYKYIGGTEIDLVIKNIILSITYYNYNTSFIEVTLFEPTESTFINSYTDNVNNITHMYNVSNMDVLKINNIYDKSELIKYYDNEISTEDYYLPGDVVHIINNKK